LPVVKKVNMSGTIMKKVLIYLRRLHHSISCGKASKEEKKFFF
jgi:hypothetical protein